jgi:hypothetical protein
MRLYQDMRTSSTTQKEAVATPMEATLEFSTATNRHRTMEDMLLNEVGTLELRHSLETCNDTRLLKRRRQSLLESEDHFSKSYSWISQPSQHNSSGHFLENRLAGSPHALQYLLALNTYSVRAFAVYVAKSRHSTHPDVSPVSHWASALCFHVSRKWPQNASTWSRHTFDAGARLSRVCPAVVMLPYPFLRKFGRSRYDRISTRMS